ncbi:MAG: ATP-dependent DNA ligase [Synechococcaceae cyanobacterium]|nr:ATP-dependent DNA ligase [Synechococcaceae cyanobacterium]
MRAFCQLYDQLDRSSATGARVQALLEHFAAAAPADAAWAVHVLLGRQGKRLITGRRLRQICLAGSPLPEWLFEDCYAQVGDSAETIALLWQQVAPEATGALQESSAAATPLHRWMEQLLPQVAALEGEEQAQAVRRLWRDLSANELLVANKLLTGGLRVGVGQGLVLRALAQVSGVEEAVLRHRLMGGFRPSAAAYEALLAPPGQEEAVPSRPYPFFLASPLETGTEGEGEPLPGGVEAWLAEWKYDGIRGQLIRRAGEGFLWSRGEELINGVFPELIAASALLPEGTVLDGEVLVWPPGAERPAGFQELQKRLGRRAPGRALLSSAPAAFVAYDLLEHQGSDWREKPLRERRRTLELVLQGLPETDGMPRLRLSPLLPLAEWHELEALRAGSSAAGAEGLMLKAVESKYQAGRRRGSWWKHKREPLRLDAVLLYAQAGSGRRANLFTDYTFGLWNEGGELVSFAKAYSGLNDAEIGELDRWIRRHTIDRFGPVRAVQPELVFELAFEGLQRSTRHKSGIAVRFPRIARWRRDKAAAEADTLDSALGLLGGGT